MTDDTPAAVPMTTLETPRLEALMDRLEMDSGIVDMMGDAILVVNDDGLIVRSNAQATALFGYRPEEFAVLHVEDLVPMAARDAHVAHRLGYQAAPSRHRMGAGRVLMGLRRDGQEVEVEIMLNRFRARGGILTVAVVRSTH